MPKSAGSGRHGLPGLRRRRSQGGTSSLGSKDGPGSAAGPETGGPHDPARPDDRSLFSDLGSHGSYSEAGRVEGAGYDPAAGGSGSPAGGLPGAADPAGDLAGEVRRRGWPAGRVAAVSGGVAVLAAVGVTLVYVGLPGSKSSGGSAQGPGQNTVLPLGSRSISQSGSRPEFAGGSSSPAPGQPGSGTSGPLRTSCQSVAHIGDSTSDGLISADYLPKKWQRIPARYRHVGARHVWTNIEGARSIVEVIPGTTNGYDAALQMTRQGFRGCWVLALGTDDTADVAAGSLTSLSTRIHRMMAAAHGQPVMWVNVRTLLSSGPYAEANMQRWDNALLRACARYPNMRVYDWAAAAKKRWFISDGIHYTSPGYAARGRLIAHALAAAFPAQGQSAGCVVR